MSYLIIGLGNIGSEYELTRHNIGFLVLDAHAEKHKVKFSPDRHAYVAEVRIRGKKVTLIKPTTYMNLSGKAMRYWMQQLKIEKPNTMTVVDDIAIPFGKIRVKPRGSAAGHNGLKNIEELCGGQDYPRLRFGIGDNFHKGQQVKYVLERFSPTEFEALPPIIDHSVKAIETFISQPIERVMTTFNQ